MGQVLAFDKTIKLPLGPTLALGKPIQKAIAAGYRTIIIPEGTGYTMNTGEVVFQDDVTIKGERKDSVSIALSIGGSGDTTAVFVSTGKNRIAIEDIKFTGLTPARVVLSAKTTKKITLKNIDCGNICLFWSERTSFFTEYQFVSSSTACRDITIEGCRGVGVPGTSSNIQQFIEMRFCYDWTIRDCWAFDYGQGIQWWGGDSANTSQSGSDWLSGERKCQNGLIENCHMWDVAFGCIWGAMGRNIKVRDCTAGRADDVVYDAEGCIDTQFVNCLGEDGINAILAVFYGSKNVKFIGCTVKFTDTSVWHDTLNRCLLFGSWNSSGIPGRNKGTVMENCTFEASGLAPDGTYPMISDAPGCMGDPVIRNCKLINCRISLQQSNNKHIRIIENEFDNGIAPTAAMSVIAAAQAFYADTNWDTPTTGNATGSARADENCIVIEGNIIRQRAALYSNGVYPESAVITTFSFADINAIQNTYINNNKILANDGIIPFGAAIRAANRNAANTTGRVHIYAEGNMLPEDCTILIEDSVSKMGSTTNGSAVVTIKSTETMPTIANGRMVAGPGIPLNATVSSFDSTAKTITLSSPATADGTDVRIRVYMGSNRIGLFSRGNKRIKTGMRIPGFTWTVPAGFPATVKANKIYTIPFAFTAQDVRDYGVSGTLFNWTWEVRDTANSRLRFDMFNDGSSMLLRVESPWQNVDAWAAGTAYVVGDLVINGANVYRVTTAGTSAGSGGPTGTGGSITDNTVTWAYAGAADIAMPSTLVLRHNERTH